MAAQSQSVNPGTQLLERSVAALVTPRTVAVVGASAKRRTQGNGVIQNLRNADYQGRIIPVHATAETVDGLEAVAAIDQLPRGIDVAVVAIPAAGVAATLGQLDRAGVRSAMVFTNGFSLAEETEFRQLAAATGMVIHGPNCMGLINVSDSTGAVSIDHHRKSATRQGRAHRPVRLGGHFPDELDLGGVLESRHHGQRVSGDGARLHQVVRR